MNTDLLTPQRIFNSPVRYEIPEFQRRYVWNEEDQWEPLWGDVELLLEQDSGEMERHFLGAIVFQLIPFPAGTIERRIVVDGQQRLITLQLLIGAAKSTLKTLGFLEEAERLGDLVANSSAYCFGDSENSYKVFPTPGDRSAYGHVMHDVEISAFNSTNNQILLAYDYFANQTKLWLDRFGDDIDSRKRAAFKLERTISTALELVVIDLDSEDNPYVIFETMNARGTPLLQSDMVKNKILWERERSNQNTTAKVNYIASNDCWPFEDKWWAENVGTGHNRRPRIDIYLNYYLTLRNRKVTRRGDEFKKFKEVADRELANGMSIFEIAADIAEHGRLFEQLEQGKRSIISRFLTVRNVLRLGQTTPLLLWLLSSNIQPETLVRCAQALESYLIRRAICSFGTRNYANMFVQIIQQLALASSEHADAVIVKCLCKGKTRADIWPDDSELLRTFKENPMYKWLTQSRVALVLWGIENQLVSEAKTEIKEFPFRNLHIEHIMPQSWQEHWPITDSVDESRPISEKCEYRNQQIHTIGNLTLVNSKLNQTMSNSPWHLKKDELEKHSMMYLNKDLLNNSCSKWDEDSIQTRAIRLHSLAVKAWPSPTSLSL